MKISTFNINSINARLPNLLNWLAQTAPDVVLLQEIKTETGSFPFFDLMVAGYQAKILGQKSYNGVAVLSRHKINVVAEGIPGFADENARYLEVEIDINGRPLRAASVYLPNGNPSPNNPTDSSKLNYKLDFMKALYERASCLLQSGTDIILGGDFNVILNRHEVYDDTLFKNDALYKESVKQRLTALKYLGFYDAFRVLHPDEIGYTFWEYANRAFEQDLGMRIDYLFLSPSLTDKLKKCYVDKDPRKADKPSDHTPLTAEFDWSRVL